MTAAPVRTLAGGFRAPFECGQWAAVSPGTFLPYLMRSHHRSTLALGGGGRESCPELDNLPASGGSLGWRVRAVGVRNHVRRTPCGPATGPATSAVRLPSQLAVAVQVR